MGDDHTGAMLAMLPHGPQFLAVDGGDPASELHVTLLYLGDDHTAYTAQDRHQISSVLNALNVGPITTTVTGVQTLGNNEPPATVLMLDSPDLQELRPRLKLNLLAAGVPIPEDTYPDYLPHLTLGYGLNPDDYQDRVGEIITLDRVGAFYGPDRAEIPLKEETRMGDRFYAEIARMGVPTGDRRIIAPGAVTYRDLPRALRWQEFDAPGHEGSVVIGRIDSIDIDPASGLVTAYGELLDPDVIPEVVRARELIRNGVLGISVDAGMAEYEDTMDGWTLFTRYEIAAFTALPIAAFASTPIMLLPDSEDAMPDSEEQCYDADGNAIECETEDSLLYSLIASIRSEGWSDMDVYPADTEWDGAAAADRVFDWATDGDVTDWSRYARAFLYQNDDADPETKGAYGFGIADVTNGQLAIVPKAVYAVAGALSGARGGTTIPEVDQERMRSVIRGLYDHLAEKLDDDSIEAPFALVASAGRFPPVALFDNPGFTTYTPLMITEVDGFRRLTGHIAPLDVPHRGLPGQVYAPRSTSGYREFLLGGTMTAEGVLVPTGPVTIGGGHAATNLSAQAAAEHYDDAGTRAASVAIGEDDFGIWISGVIKDGVADVDAYSLLEFPPSGDWRADQFGNLELILIHQVNTPGFPVYRVNQDMASGQVYALVASADAWKGDAAATFSVDLDGDLEAQFADAGIPWPTIGGEYGGKTYDPVPVASGCVLRMLRGAASDVEFASSDAERNRAKARLALTLEGV